MKVNNLSKREKNDQILSSSSDEQDSDITHSSMPDLISDLSESLERIQEMIDTISDFSDSDESDSDQDILTRNNILYKQSKNNEIRYIGIREEYPPNLDESITAGVHDTEKKIFTNSRINNSITSNDESNTICNMKEIIIDSNNDPTINSKFSSDSKYGIYNNICFISNNYTIQTREDEIEDIYFGSDRIIQSRNIQWFIRIPIKFENGEVVKVRAFADSGANETIINAKWALDHFPNTIRRDKSNQMMDTPGGLIKPKYCLWMSFPCKDGTILKKKFYLVNNLNVDILLDINTLKAFGYQFREETPDIFQHDEESDLDLELPDDDEILSNRRTNPFNNMVNKKLKSYENNDIRNQDRREINLIDRIYANDELIHEYNDSSDDGNYSINKTNKIFSESDYEITENKELPYMVNLIRKQNGNEILNLNNVKQEDLIRLTKDENIDKAINILNTVNDKKSNVEKPKSYHSCLFIMANNSFLATKEEIAKAKKLFVNERLQFPNFDYLKKYEKRYGKQFRGLYPAIMDWVRKNKDIFATHTFSRKTMKTEYARLGIKEEYRDKIMYAKQYPISESKRLHMINYTIENEKNGFWYKISQSQHCIPYTMVPKKNKQGIVTRMRPAFDGRIVNQYCRLMQCMMPTLQDFRNLHQTRGLTTMMDIKNCFDCIPLHPADRKYAVCLTPMGLYSMTCLTYGWMNAAPEAQKRMNRLAMYITNCLAYIDDIQIKHPLEEGTSGIIKSLDRGAEYMRKHNYQVNTKKFYPAIDEADGFGFKFTMIGELVSESYQRKLLALVKPMTKPESRTTDGILNYVGHNIYKLKYFMYHINKLSEYLDIKTGKKRLKWTPEANLCWDLIRWLIQNLPLLYHPTKEGQFCIVVDASNYALGAVLWQQQKVDDSHEYEWRMIDMYSKIIPQQLRPCHSLVHEAYSLVRAMVHWQFYLIRKRFNISTDNMPVATIFGQFWKELSPITQQQLQRLRQKVGMFSFNSYHIKGIENKIADGLSRKMIELIKIDQKKPKEQQQYPFNLKTIESDDTRTPKLTPEQKEELRLSLIEDQKLRVVYEQFQKRKRKHNRKLNKVVNNLQLKPSDIKLKGNKNNNINQFSKLKLQYNQYEKEYNKGWSDLLRCYKLNAHYLEREKLNHLFYSSENDLIKQNDNYINQSKLKDLELNCINLINKVNELDSNMSNILQYEINNNQWQNLQEMRLLSDTLNNTNNMINMVDKDYNVQEEIEYDSDEIEMMNKKTSEIITRSRVKRKLEKLRSERKDDDSVEEEFEFTKLNIQFNDIREHMESHEDFMFRMFGHRDDMDIFNFSEYRNRQESDNVLAAAIRLFKIDDKTEWKEEDINLVKDWEYGLYVKLINDKVLIDCNMLCVYDMDPVKEEEVIKIVIPFNLRGKIMDYAHHNLLLHHFSFKLTYNTLAQRYWWFGMKTDVEYFCDHCTLCQFTKGGKRNRSPLVIRERPLPRQHIFIDFLGPVYFRYYILVIIDYATGYVMLIPTVGCDAITIAKMLIDYWIRIFGYFTKLETDWGSGFTSKLIKYLSKLLNFDHELAEPRNHRSIGKVERIIGFLQSVINHYNLLLERELTDNIDDIALAWTKVKIVIPFIQLAFNQRILRITGISPNMAIFGVNMNDSSDAQRLKHQITIAKKDKKLSKNEFQLLQEIEEAVRKMHSISETNWKDVTWLSAKSYDARNKITPSKIARNLKRFKVGSEILYFIGDKQVSQRKWKEKWTGPWIVSKHLNKSTLIITDPTTGNQKRVSFDRIKQFNKQEFIKYEDIIKHDEGYIQYQKNLLKTLSNYNVKINDKDVNLDYTKKSK